ncbi:ATP-binding mismatch repair protein [Oleoguttula sp. CCFEE 5521]
MATIKAIESRSVHQIQSGQVIVDLNSVVKELVENSLDAGATSIDVRFKNHGLDSIEVQDNGRGLSPDDFDTVALKHHTSKLSSYDDLTSLDTFGFRGEALSSLCALSKLHVVTARAEDGAVGKKLDFEVSGKLKGAAVTSAQKGTTVAVEDLFYSLPVRRKELEKNVKREYGKVIGLLHAYACISVGVRYSVSNHVPKVFSTKANTTTRENIVNVYGAKTLLALVKLDLKLEMEPGKGPSTQSVRNWSTQASDDSRAVRVEGHISKPGYGEGRQAPDRQMFFVNSRPCALPQVAKAVNEVYRSYNHHQTPFIFANLIMDTNAYDVNVSPDKRTIMLHDQTALLDSLKLALTDLFDNADHTVPQSSLPSRTIPSYKPLTVNRELSTVSSQPGSGESGSDSDDESDKEKAQSMKTHVKPSVGAARPTVSSNFIESWAGRDSELRKSKVPNTRTPTVAFKAPSGGSNVSRKPSLESHLNSNNASSKTSDISNAVDPTQEPRSGNIVSLSREIAADDEHSRSDATSRPTLHEPDPMSTAYGALFSQRPPEQVDIQNNGTAKDDFLAQEDDEDERALEHEDIQINALAEAENEIAVHTIATSAAKPTPGPVPNAFDRMRPQRTPLQVAEITVGDQTTTTVLGGSPAYKKRRIHEPSNSQAIAAFGCSPLLARGLRNLAAAGSQMQIDSSDMPLEPTRRASGNESDSEDDDEEPILADVPPPSKTNVKTRTGPGTVTTATPVSLPRDRVSQHRDDSNEVPTSDALDALEASAADDDTWDEDYIDENEKRILEDEKIARMIQELEEHAAKPSTHNLARASKVTSGSALKDMTLQLECQCHLSMDDVARDSSAAVAMDADGHVADGQCDNSTIVKGELEGTQAEDKLSLIVSKADFARMRVVGQFNLGFILAVRPAATAEEQDELFIIDQHAADEKYNYERFQRRVTLQSQRLVRPKNLDLTAVEQEVVLNHADALKANGFEIETTSAESTDADESFTRFCRLLTLPTSQSTTFDLSDLSELLYLLSEAPTGTNHVPRPKKVQRMLAMRACRSSIMVGKTLTMKQMEKVVKHMGEMEKPWNCPHGRPTMRHLAGLKEWVGWREGDVVFPSDEEETVADGTDWKAWLSERR